MNEVMDSPYFQLGGFVAKLHHEESDSITVFSQCVYSHSNRKILLCDIPEFNEKFGSYNIAFSLNGGKNFIETTHTLIV
jgi:hypothetical protein